MPRRLLKRYSLRVLPLALLSLIAPSSAMAQSAAFTFQGRLTDAGNPATGIYDMQFKPFNTATVGTGEELGVVTNPSVNVSNGVFTVVLDFGEEVFDGSDRFLEIALRPAGSTDPYTVLAPRQPITSSPYALRSLKAESAEAAANATLLGGVPSSGFVQNTTSQQVATNFNISGTGTANILDAQTQFNIGGSRVLSIAGTDNLFVGINSGASNSGTGNTFFGKNAGLSNSTGDFNAFFGRGAGINNTTASGNSFFGTSAGFNNTTGQFNAFFGEGAGSANTTGSGNTFIGRDADFDVANPTGDNNTLLGSNAKVISGVSNSTAIGAGVVVATNNTVVLGKGEHSVQIPGSLNISGNFSAPIVNAQTQFRIGGIPVLSTPGTGNLLAGAGAGALNTGSQNSFFGFNAGNDNTTGSNNVFIGANAGNPDSSTQVNNCVAIGSGATVTTSNTIVLGTNAHTTRIPGKLVMGGGPVVGGLGTVAESFTSSVFFGLFTGNIVLQGPALNNVLSSTVHLCIRGLALDNGFGGEALSRCVSSLSSTRYKTAMEPFSGGLEVIDRLNPVAFSWKEEGTRDIGLSAEDVAEVEPLLVSRNAKGEVEDVKHESMIVLFINAIKQQQAQIELLKKIVCRDHPDAEVCKANK